MLLTRPFRQAEDPEFAAMLGGLRVGAVTHACRLRLEAASRTDLTNPHGIEPTRLHARNNQVCAREGGRKQRRR